MRPKTIALALLVAAGCSNPESAFKEFDLWRESYPGGLSELEEEFASAMTLQATKRRRMRRVAVTATIAVLLGVVAVVGVLIAAGSRRLPA